MLACSACLYMLATNTEAYLRHEVDTVIENIEDSQDNPTDFPTITLCTVEVCLTNLTNQSYKSFYQNFSYSLFNTNDFMPGNQSSKSLNELAKHAYIDFLQANQLDLDQILNRNDLKSIILNCQYNGANCDETDFVPFKLNDFQSCFRFNGRTNVNGEPTTIKKTQRYGKQFILFYITIINF